MTYSMHGGAGALISVGMLSNITWDWMHECVTRSYSTGESGVGKCGDGGCLLGAPTHALAP